MQTANVFVRSLFLGLYYQILSSAYWLLLYIHINIYDDSSAPSVRDTSVCGSHNGVGQFFVWCELEVRRCVTDCECNTGVLGPASTNDTLVELRLWLQTVASFGFWVFNVWPVVASLFVNGYKGAQARDDARVGNLAKHDWVLVYAIVEATTAIPTFVLADIKRILEDKHDCATEEEREAAMK